MAKFLEGQIKSLTGAVVSEDVPPAQRKRGSRSSAKSWSRASAKPKRQTAAKSKPRTSKAKRARKRAGAGR